MSINIGDNFSYLGKKFLDARQSFKTYASMRLCHDVPIGFITYCEETNLRYEYTSEGWVEYKNSGVDDETLANINKKIDNIEVNADETTDMQTALDLYANGEVLKTVYFAAGGGGSIASAYISTTLSENLIVETGKNLNLLIDFASPNPGRGTIKVFINDVEGLSQSMPQGESTVVVSNTLLTKGTNRLTVYVIDRFGVMSNSLTFYVRYGSTELTSDFDVYSAYDYGATIRYYFVPTAIDTSLVLTFYMSIDSVVQEGILCSSDTRGTYTFPNNLSAGSHVCEAYIIDSNGTKSNVLKFNLVILDTNTLVAVSDTTDLTVEEGMQVSLDYKVYMRNNTSFITKTYVNGTLVNTGTCGLDFNYYRTTSLTAGINTIVLEVYDVTETYKDSLIWQVTVTASTYEMLQPVKSGAIFIGSAVNKSNADERRQYFVGHDQDEREVLGTLTNFAYNSESGWVNDELIISGNSHVEIPLQPLANNAKYGFTLDIEFTSKQIGVAEAEVLTLWNDETNCGIKITTEKLILQSSNGNKCDLYFTDNERTHVMFIIDRQELKAKIYLNGVMCEAFHLNDYTVDGVAYLDDFTVNSNIVLGGLNKNGYCKIRNLRVYQVALTTDEIINNFISCEIDMVKQKSLVEFQKGNDLPTFYVYCDFSGLGKDDKKPCKIIYQSTDEEKYGKSFVLDHYKSQLQYQGTSSMAYPIKNYRFNLRDEFGDKLYYDFPGGQGECRFTLKADFMSSGHWTNTGMAKFINDNLYNYKSGDEKSMNPFRWYRLQNGDDVSKYRETINGFPCRLILINDGSTPLNEGQNEPTPGNTKDMGIFNFNHDKDATKTLGFDSDIFPNCASYEVTANSDTSAGAFISAKNGLRPNLFSKGQFVYGTYTDDLTKGVSVKMLNDNSFEVTTSSQRPHYAGLVLSIPTEINTEYTLKAICNVSYGASYMCLSNGKPNTGDWIQTVNTDTELGFTFTATTDITEIFFYALKDRISENNGSGFVTYKNVRIQETKEISEADELTYLKESFELRHPDADDVAEDWGFMGIETTGKCVDYWIASDKMTTTRFTYSDTSIEVTGADVSRISCYGENGYIASASGSNGIYTMQDGTTKIDITFTTSNIEKFYINGVMYIPGTTVNMNATREPYDSIVFDTSYGLKALIDWVDNCTDEEFVADFEEHFHKDYTLRYFCLVTLIGAVDNLGKNMMLDTADNKIYFPRFYDIDTICSYDNSGQLKFDVDIEMEQGYWNTSSSRLWTRIRDLMHNDIVTTYNNMRQNGVSYENMMKYIYDEQIAKIPQTYYNKDYDVKYAPFADSYIGMAHGDTYEHVKRWLRQRFTFVDTLFDYAPSYNNDVLTIRANTTELMTLEIETYTPVYQHLSWYNGQMDKKKIDGKISVKFSGTAQAATDQEVLIYGGSNVKSIKGITSMNPNRMLIGSATKLVEIDAHDCPLLADINANKANLSPHEYLNKVNLSNCPLLEGNLRLNNSPLVQEINIKGTKITGMNLPSSIRNLQVLRLPNTMTNLTLNDAGMLHTLEFDKGINLQSVSMTNCNALENVIGLDLLQTPSITLNNSYNTVAELYFRDTTNLSLSNMSNLERVIFTPNNEYETFELINVANAPNYKVTTFNCPKLSTFMTTAPYRESYNDCDKIQETRYVKDYNNLVDILINKTPLNAIVDYSTGTVTSSTSGIHFTSQDYIEVKGDTEYSINITNGTSSLLNLAFYNNSLEYINGVNQNSSWSSYTFTTPSDCCYIRYQIYGSSSQFQTSELLSPSIIEEIVYKKDYGDIQPNTTFTANSIDISNTQFTDVKLLCTTDTNTLKLPTTVKNFYCDSSFDLDTDYLEDGEYDVVHGELVESYTTDYDGEVDIYRTKENSTLSFDDLTWNLGILNSTTGLVDSNNYRYTCDEFIHIQGDTDLTTTYEILICAEYDENKNFLSATGWRGAGSVMHLNTYTCYVRFSIYPHQIEDNTKEFEIKYTGLQSYTPNLIPSSADGSLIFSMYAPSKTVQPSSGIWDLKGLEFDNFHTFGMNNDVKPNEDSYIKCYTDKIIAYHASFWGSNSGTSVTTSQKELLMIFDRLKLFGEVTTFTITASDNKIVQGGHFNSGWTSGYSGTRDVTTFTWTVNAVTPYLVAKVNISDEVKWIQFNNVRIPLSNLDIREVATTSPIVEGLLEVNAPTQCNMILDKTPTSITMPSRYDDYNITIKNANISPKTHNTMLYPLLVNEDNPIIGTLDYTNYEGKHLSWSFAYTDEEYVDIIQPKYELLNSYEYKYNAFYDTEYEFDNPYEVARYTSSASGVLPTFNSGFTYTYDEIDNGDGTYTTKVYADDLDNLPTTMKFSYSDVIEILKWNASNVNNMASMFYGCNKLEKINNIENLVTSNVTDISKMFYNCTGLTSLDLSKWDTSNVTNMEWLFRSCFNLTSLDVSGFDTSLVQNMTYMFQDATNLTTLDLSDFDTSSVTNMYSMFLNCSKLTSLDLSGFDTSKVTNMAKMFYGCSKITSLDVSNFDTTNVTDMSDMFWGCSSLTSLDLSDFDASNVTIMPSMFRGCSNLTELDLSGFNTSKVTDTSHMFNGCTNLTSLDLSGFDTSKVTNMSSMFYGCSKLTSLDLSGFDTSKVTNMDNILKDCKSLTELDSMQNISADLDLSTTILDVASLLDVINNLATVTTKTITLGSTLLNKLTESQIAIAINKGWTVA